MEGDGHDTRAVEWIIRGMLLVLTLTAVWTVFGDDLATLIAR